MLGDVINGGVTGSIEEEEDHGKNSLKDVVSAQSRRQLLVTDECTIDLGLVEPNPGAVRLGLR